MCVYQPEWYPITIFTDCVFLYDSLLAYWSLHRTIFQPHLHHTIQNCFNHSVQIVTVFSLKYSVNQNGSVLKTKVIHFEQKCLHGVRVLCAHQCYASPSLVGG